ncbi:MAG: phosphate acyltransferase PlsX [Candidatus Midichloria sp.]|nr:phosphate acyltransferase PlsX [Candidatus Midichloria sp.]
MQKVVISLDAMGGINAPTSVIEAAFNVAKLNPRIHFLIFGSEDKVVPILQALSFPEERYDFIATKDVIQDHDKPLHAFKNGKESSMRKAIDAVKEGLAHACVSCGNTGALMVTAKMVLGTLPGVKRPAIAGAFPTYENKLIMLDMGANNECSESVIFQFALMGRCLAKVVLQIDNPSIAILNVGEEETKGRELEQKSYELLKSSGLNFIGYIEGHDIVKGKADVVVTDGFSGNLVLKASEGAINMFMILLKEISKNSGLIALVGAFLLKRAFKKKLTRIDPNVNNGAMFIGLDGIVIKSHGSATTFGVTNAIGLAYELANRDINAQITKEIKDLEERGIGLNFVEKIKQTSAKILGIPT